MYSNANVRRTFADERRRENRRRAMPDANGSNRKAHTLPLTQSLKLTRKKYKKHVNPQLKAPPPLVRKPDLMIQKENRKKPNSS